MRRNSLDAQALKSSHLGRELKLKERASLWLLAKGSESFASNFFPIEDSLNILENMSTDT